MTRDGPAVAAWPERPVKLLVPFGPGGPADVIARVLAPPLGEAIGASFVIENKPGAGGNIGVGLAARAELTLFDDARDLIRRAFGSASL